MTIVAAAPNPMQPQPIAQPAIPAPFQPIPPPFQPPAMGAPPNAFQAQLNQSVQQKQLQRNVQHTISRNLSYDMKEPGGTFVAMPIPIRYRVHISDQSKQSAEITIDLLIKVHSGDDGVRCWERKGGSRESFYKTGWQDKPGVVPAVATQQVRDAWSRKINQCWGKVGVVWREKVYSLKFQFAYVDDASQAGAEVVCVDTQGEALTVNPTGTIDSIRWGVRDTDQSTRGMICHEVGHLVGNPDEYYEIRFQGQEKDWGEGWQTGPEHGVMNNPNNPPLMRNYKLLARELIDAFGITPNEAFLIPDVAMPSQNRKKYTDPFW